MALWFMQILLRQTPNVWKQTLRIISKRQPPSSRLWRSRSNIQLSEIVSSLFPLSQYITLSYSSLMKKPFTSNNMYKIGLRNYKEEHINRVFSSVLYREQRGGVRKWLSTSESLCRIYTQKKLSPITGFKINSHSPLHFPNRYIQNDKSHRLSIHSEGAKGPF